MSPLLLLGESCVVSLPIIIVSLFSFPDVLVTAFLLMVYRCHSWSLEPVFLQQLFGPLLCPAFALDCLEPFSALRRCLSVQGSILLLVAGTPL